MKNNHSHADESMQKETEKPNMNRPNEDALNPMVDYHRQKKENFFYIYELHEDHKKINNAL